MYIQATFKQESHNFLIFQYFNFWNNFQNTFDEDIIFLLDSLYSFQFQKLVL